MGQKVHPYSLRVGYIFDWKSVWFSERNFAENLNEDLKIREHIIEKLSHAGLSDITIRKSSSDVTVDINTARPGIVIGKSGSEVDSLRKELHDLTGKQVKVNILEVKRPELDAKLVSQSIAEQLQNRVAYRRAMKRALTSAIRSGAHGVRIQVSGRLGGAEMARRQSYSDGSVPLHTMRADIDYGFTEARTTAGRIGVKCWINKGEVMPEGFTDKPVEKAAEPVDKASDRRKPKAKVEKKASKKSEGGKKPADTAGDKKDSSKKPADDKTDVKDSKKPTEGSDKPAESSDKKDSSKKLADDTEEDVTGKSSAEADPTGEGDDGPETGEEGTKQ